jgi:molecular chaperone GrpE
MQEGQNNNSNSEEDKANKANANENTENQNNNSQENDLEKVLEQKIEELQRKLLFEMAEIENMRKRSERQIKDASDYAISSFARDLMSVMDNLEKALEHHGVSDNSNTSKDSAGNSAEIKNLMLGVEMTKNELSVVFSKYGLVKILPKLGDKFDYETHQAISYQESEEFEVNTISNIMQSGYMLKDRLLRPAMVVVSKGK